MAILEEIADATGTEVGVASVYAALDRLERRRMVTSRVGAPTPERGGRAKRFFSLEPAGRTALHRSRSALDALWEGVEMDPDGLA
jgi:DNA-binding PadR family transcriptional regulator